MQAVFAGEGWERTRLVPFSFFFSLLKLVFNCVCMCSCMGYVYVCTESMQVRRGCWIPWIWSHRQFWTACCGCWKLNLDSLEGQQVLSTTMSFLQPRAAVFLDCPAIPGHSSPWDGWRGESRTPRLSIQLLSLLPLGTTWKFIPEWVLEGAATGKKYVSQDGLCLLCRAKLPAFACSQYLILVEEMRS